jgi:hypothetical protein
MIKVLEYLEHRDDIELAVLYLSAAEFVEAGTIESRPRYVARARDRNADKVHIEPDNLKAPARCELGERAVPTTDIQQSSPFAIPQRVGVPSWV